MKDPEYSFDEIAETIFGPIYPIIAADIVKETGITSGRLLDVGCGGGHLGIAMLKLTKMNGELVDIHPQAIEIAQTRLAEVGLSQKGHASVQDIHALDFSDNSFDLVISRGSMGFWQNIDLAFREIYRVLKPGGKTYIGGGMGNAETQKIIDQKMKALDPNWPHSVMKNQHKLSTAELHQKFSSWGVQAKIIDSKERGRWIILEKM
ncbi:class I SAM-dependent methyltransferase [Enterococcus hirae]|jgi:ubiquinone/menaquinone biosynthesis C-methylase UbiE|nr:class I SAM-dependent methyltransferase [Enterococcaceae bacterium]MDM8214082.1 class I SAM-dependent methyltransferase [Enterococcus hirae]